MAANGISTEVVEDPDSTINWIATKIKRRTDKLALAASKRQTPDTPGYRPLNTILDTHEAYVSTELTSLSGTASPDIGHPWSEQP